MTYTEKAAAAVVCDLVISKQYLQDVKNLADKHRSELQPLMQLPSARAWVEDDLHRIGRLRADIERTENLIATFPADDLTRKIVDMRSRQKSWAAITTTLYISENAARRRFWNACRTLYPLMADAGLLRNPPNKNINTG